MDIAEIRKKARIGSKSIPMERDVNVNLHGATEEIGPQAPSVPVPPVVCESSDVTPLNYSVSTLLPESSNASGLDGLEKLFSQVTEGYGSFNDAYGSSLTAEHEKVEVEARRWLAFVLGSEEYSLDIRSIREIIKPREITDIPRVPDFLLGIISLRGNIIPVIDLKNRLRLGVTSVTNDSRIIVCQDGERYAGLLVDRITQVVSISEDAIEPPPAVLSGVDRELVGGVGRCQGKMLILLHVSCVLNIEVS